MTEHPALPLNAEEQRVAREIQRYGVTIQKIHPDDDPTKISFTLGATAAMRTGVAVLLVTHDWNAILSVLKVATAFGRPLSGGKVV